jgi:hypothetical protein
MFQCFPEQQCAADDGLLYPQGNGMLQATHPVMCYVRGFHPCTHSSCQVRQFLCMHIFRQLHGTCAEPSILLFLCLDGFSVHG